MSWPRGCSRARRRPSIWAARPRRRAAFTASTNPRPPTSAGGACSLAGSWSAACGSSRSGAACRAPRTTGTTTATSPRSCRPSRGRWTARPPRCCATSRPGACSTTRWSSGAPSSAGSRSPRAPTGRDHNGGTSVAWLAGAGVKGGSAHGESDPWAWKAAAGQTYCYDLHATILHLLGIDHTRLTFRHNGIDRRITDVHGHVVTEILA